MTQGTICSAPVDGTLVDIRDVNVDPTLPKEDRIAEFLRQIRNLEGEIKEKQVDANHLKQQLELLQEKIELLTREKEGLENQPPDIGIGQESHREDLAENLRDHHEAVAYLNLEILLVGREHHLLVVDEISQQ